MNYPEGFLFSAVEANLRYKNRRDLALLYIPKGAIVRGVFTTNKFQAAPVLVCKENLAKQKYIKAIMINAGQANACTGEKGLNQCWQTLKFLAQELKLSPREILPVSTGVIGELFDLSKWEAGVKILTEHLGKSDLLDVAKAIMTTDKYPKIVQTRLDLSAGTTYLWGIAKGAGMIAPNMATMLGFVLCDLDVDPLWWQEVIKKAVDKSFNRICVDGDTSTNDTVLGICSRQKKWALQEADLRKIKQAVEEICYRLAYLIVQDGEGATKVVHLKVKGAKSLKQAERVARTIATSPLVKTAFFGQDPNWGRIVAAIGRSGEEIEPQKVKVSFADIEVFAQNETQLKDVDALLGPYLQKQEIEVSVDLGLGTREYWLLFSDLSIDYVRLNSNYRS
ncbi:MAG: glutamate N-acetyltransferase / amino-acid N-acetyltransferase [Desulfonauticus sp.]|jgi:glutamate N-acetyltransferase/amino-acid N-acetyltransferase|nr:glutamate N-acetyltransferase / amino-acid N-acetyltransferase [Desulfonauticus sp.]